MTEVPDRSRWTDDRLDRMSDPLDSFIAESQRLSKTWGERQARIDASVESMVDAVTRLTQSSAQQWQAIQQMQTEVRGLQVQNHRILQRVFGDE